MERFGKEISCMAVWQVTHKSLDNLDTKKHMQIILKGRACRWSWKPWKEQLFPELTYSICVAVSHESYVWMILRSCAFCHSIPAFLVVLIAGKLVCFFLRRWVLSWSFSTRALSQWRRWGRNEPQWAATKWSALGARQCCLSCCVWFTNGRCVCVCVCVCGGGTRTWNLKIMISLYF